MGTAPAIGWLERTDLRRLRDHARATTIARGARTVPGGAWAFAEDGAVGGGGGGALTPEVVLSAIGAEAFSVRALRAHARRLGRGLTGGISALLALIPRLDWSSVVGWRSPWVSGGACIAWMAFALHARWLVGIAACTGALVAGVALAHERPLGWIACVGEEEADGSAVAPAASGGMTAAIRAAASARRELRRRRGELIRLALAAQHAVHDAAVWAERVRALVVFADRRASTLFFGIVAAAGAAASAVPLRWIAVVVGLFLLRPPALRVYGRPPPPLNLVLRLPCLEETIV